MLDFMPFKVAVNKQFTEIEKHGLFVTDVGKDELWECYLNSFPEGTNPMFRKRTEHDCQCCKQFIRACGSAVTIKDNELISIWDINIGGTYQVVADALSALVKSKNIKDKFLHYENSLGTDYNYDTANADLKWNHFHYKLESKFVRPNHQIATELGSFRTSIETFKRALEEITPEAVETVLDLIAQNSLYRGEENKRTISEFERYQREYLKLDNNLKDIYCWNSDAHSSIMGIRNSSIGTLLVDLSDGKDLSAAVGSYEAKVAPTNYKRPKALITSGMINKAQDKVKELGISESLKRRFAHMDDITINNVIFANRDTKKALDVFDEMQKEIAINVNKFDKVEEISINDFVEKVLPTVNDIELMFENKHINHLVSLIAPIVPDSPNILKWDNNFSWSYNGEVTDSMKERVKKAGGKVDGILRFSLQWNDNLDDEDIDFDAHCFEPNGNHIYYPSNGRLHRSSGILDVDNTHPGKEIAVENITWSNKHKMQKGHYIFNVHNYSSRTSKSGFTAELEYKGKIYTYVYNKPLRGNQTIEVVTIDFNAIKETMEIIKSLPSELATKEAWNINTNGFHKVSMVMQSPNHWDEQKIGNKHWFFMLEGCKNPNSARGFYNEFLNNDLIEHRKVFEVLGSKMKTEMSDNQLSGLGFSSTKHDSVLCKVSSSFSRVLKINF